jgi:hypothetical protein
LVVLHSHGQRIHKTLRVTPSMAAGLTDRLWSMEEIAELVVDAPLRSRAGVGHT